MLCSNSKNCEIEDSQKQNKYYFGEMINEKMEFLVLLTEDDLLEKKWFWQSSLNHFLLSLFIYFVQRY